MRSPEALREEARRLINAANAVADPESKKGFATRAFELSQLAEALEDPAYRTPDDYLGSDGFSCLLHWAQAENMLMAPRPPEPPAIRKLYAQIVAK